MKDKELKLCPFCGALEEMIGDNRVIKHSPKCFLYKYCATMYIYDERKDKWNTRTSPIQEIREWMNINSDEFGESGDRMIYYNQLFKFLDTLEKE